MYCLKFHWADGGSRQGWAILEDFIAIPILGVRIVGNWINPKHPRIVSERIDWIIKSSKKNWLILKIGS